MATKVKIPVVVCEFHQEVLQFIHRFIARKRLPFNGIKMIHFDSHPDLAFPDRLCADDCYRKEIMYNDLDIADWILPLMYAGHINNLIWVKPPWANQIADKMLSFAVGKENNSGMLRLTCSEDYFLEDCTFAPRHRLCNINDVKVEAIKLESLLSKVKLEKYGLSKKTTSKVEEEETRNKEDTDTKCTLAETDIITGLKRIDKENYNIDSKVKRKKLSDDLLNKNTDTSELRYLFANEKYVLDIDLDFFSVTNPFLQDYTEEQYNQLREIYDLTFPPDRQDHDILDNCVSAARIKMEELKKIISSFSSMDTTTIIETDENRTFLHLLQTIKEQKSDVDWEMVHNAGMTTELPHHISSEGEIDELVNQMVELLKILPVPALITMARSTIDEYCPPDQIEIIQEKVLSALKLVYSDERLEINLDYKDTSRNL